MPEKPSGYTRWSNFGGVDLMQNGRARLVNKLASFPKQSPKPIGVLCTSRCGGVFPISKKQLFLICTIRTNERRQNVGHNKRLVAVVNHAQLAKQAVVEPLRSPTQPIRPRRTTNSIGLILLKGNKQCMQPILRNKNVVIEENGNFPDRYFQSAVQSVRLTLQGLKKIFQRDRIPHSGFLDNLPGRVG
ncbi:MAG: hypothetical protein NC910_03405 [Candidatus Omnitrophica bacterium]|nr:hypothetical protein [Candidatus Omnitrophota bacterium]